MTFNIGDIVSLESHKGRAMYKVLDVWPNGKLKKVVSYNVDYRMEYSSHNSNEWDGLNFRLESSSDESEQGPYAHVIRKIKIMDRRFQERKLA